MAKKSTEKEKKNKIELNPSLKESKGKTVVFGWGRMNPPTTGHEKLVEKLNSVARKERATPFLYLSHSSDPKKNPLSYEDKIMLARKAFGNIVQKSNAKTIIQVMKELDKKFDSAILVVGQDRVSEFENLLTKYNGKEYSFDSISVISAGDRDPDADDVTGMSASKMRSLAAQGKMNQFADGVPRNLKDDAEEVYTMVRAGMKIAEELEHYENLDEALSIQQRRQRSITMRRYKSKIAAARKRMARRPADKARIKKRAELAARKMVRSKIAGDKGKNYDDLSPAEKSLIDDKVKKRSALVARIAKRLIPKMKRKDMARIAGKTIEPIKEATSEVERLRSKQAQDRQKMRDTQEREMDRLRSRQMRSKIRAINVNEHIEAENDLEALQIIGSVASLYEAKRVKGGNPCWDGYEMVGKKKKNGKDVPNCVPKEVSESFSKNDAIAKKSKYRIYISDTDRGQTRVYEFEKDGQNVRIIVRKNGNAELFDKGPTLSGRGKPFKSFESALKYVTEETYFEEPILFENRIEESVAIEKILDAVHRNVTKGRNLMDIAFDISRAAGVDMSGQEIQRAYIAKFGDPNKKKTDEKIRSILKKKFAKESVESDGFDPAGPAGAGLQGTDRLQRRYKRDTPGEVVDKAHRKYVNESFEMMMEQSACQLVGMKQIKEFEKFVDKMFEKFNIDFNFTKHFAERLGDARNDPCITLRELAEFIKKIYKNQGKSLKDVAGAEAVIRDLQKDLNIPVAVEYDQRNDEFDVVMKTIMRKKKFRTPNKVIDYK